MSGPAGRLETGLPPVRLDVTGALKLHKEQQDADRERAADSWVETGLVFTTCHGTRSSRALLQALHRESESARNHRARTRKTCGSLLAALDVHPRVAMQILRHSKTAVTMEIYTEVPSAATRDALRKLGQWLGN